MTKPDGYPKDALDRAVLIHVCKDGTFTYRRRGEPVFNGRALPVFSVNTVEEAHTLQVLLCTLQSAEHPLMPGQQWYTLSPTSTQYRFAGEVEDLDSVTMACARLWKPVGSTTPKRAKRAKPRSRVARWADAASKAETAKSDLANALDELRDIQGEFEEWRGNLPENLQSSALGAKLDAVCDLDLDLDLDVIDEIGGIDLPLGFGRD